MRRGARSALLSGPVVAAVAAIAIVEFGVLTLALFGSDADPCARPKILRMARADSTCSGRPREVKYDQQLYTAVVDTVYHPARYSTPRHPSGLLLGDPQSGTKYLDSGEVLADLRTALLRREADDLVRDFRRANAAPATSTSEFQYVLYPLSFVDSATQTRMMNAGAAELAKDPFVQDVLENFPLDSLPPVLSLSRAGVTEDGATAMVYAAMYDRHANTPEHLEAAAFILARREGARWIVTREIPIPLARRQ